MDRNLETVKNIYAAFGRGEIAAILDCLADDVRWESWAANFAQAADVPWLRPRHDKTGVAEFFRIVGELHIRDFQVLNMMSNGVDSVSAEFVIEAEVPGGGRYRDEEMHLWTFNAEGKVQRLRHYTDTAKHIAASRGQDTIGGRVAAV